MKDCRIEPETVIYSVIILAFAVMLALGIRDDMRHQEFLQAHGCQLLTEAPTGREVYCGKACFRPERVYVYECADGTRTEVH